MMSEYRDVLERSRREVGPSRLELDRVYRRRDRKRRNERLAAGAVGLAIGIALVTLGSAYLRSAREPQPADWPLPGVTTKPLMREGEVLTGPLDRQSLVAIETSTGSERTVVRCQGDCAAIQDFGGSADRGWVAYDVLTCGGLCDPVEPEAGLWVAGAEGPPRHVSTPDWAPPWSWSPSGAQLGYGKGSDLILLDPTVWTHTRIATVEGVVSAVAWGPDGRSIAYSVDAPQGATPSAGSLGVFIIRSGGEPHRVSDTLGVSGIEWSPDGRALVLDIGASDVSRISVVNADGSDERLLVEGPSPEGPGEPIWSPDGRLIAYLRTPLVGTESNALEFWVTGSDGRGRVRLARFDTWDEWDGPVWSPDSRLVAFSRIVYSPRETSWLVAPADGSGAPERIDGLEVEGWRHR
jgi:WD40 repeat protein